MNGTGWSRSPPHERTLAAENPEWTVEIVPDLGHGAVLENPELVAEIMAD